MQLSVGAPPESRQGVCAIELPAVEAGMADRLSRAGIRSASAWETFEVFRQNLQEAEREQAHFRREGRFPAEAAANRARRAATEERLTAQPVIALGLVSAPVVALSGESACALAVRMRINGRGEPPRNVIAATGHESRRSLQLWIAGPTVHVVPAAAWERGLHERVAEMLDELLSLWRAQNPSAPPGMPPHAR